MTSTVAKRSSESEEQVECAAKSRALMDGTEGMREAGKKYLPKFPAEDELAYKDRLNQTWLFNGYRKTVYDMTGRVFSKPIELTKAPAKLMEWSKNIDNAGCDLSTFARKVFQDGLQAGVSYIMVDAPPRSGVVTVADAAKLRPYLVHLTTDDILGWKSAVIDGSPTLTQLRIMECVLTEDPDDEFAQVETQQVRVLDRLPGAVQVRLFRQVNGKNGALDWVEFEQPTFTGLTEITVVPFYANRDDFFTGEPLLDDLADVNIAHWQSQSDQRNILHYARVPILFAAGRSQDDGPITVSASSAVQSTDPNAKLSWVEHSGAAIGAGRQDLKDLEFQMETHGLQLLQPKPGGQSATGEMLDSQKETSTLAMTADELKTALEIALKWMCQYGGLDPAVEAAVNKEFGTTAMDFQTLNALLSAVNTGNLSRETFIKELARRKMIDSGIDAQEEQDRIEADGQALMQAGPPTIAA